MHETWVRSLIQEDPTCLGATKPVCHNCWACALEPRSHSYWAHLQQLLKPAHPRARAPQLNRGASPCPGRAGPGRARRCADVRAALCSFTGGSHIGGGFLLHHIPVLCDHVLSRWHCWEHCGDFAWELWLFCSSEYLLLCNCCFHVYWTFCI